MMIDTEDVLAEAREKGWPVASKENVHEMMTAATEAIGKITNVQRSDGKMISGADILMLGVNLARWCEEQLEENQGVTTLEQKRFMRTVMCNSVARSLMKRLEN